MLLKGTVVFGSCFLGSICAALGKENLVMIIIAALLGAVGAVVGMLPNDLRGSRVETIPAIGGLAGRGTGEGRTTPRKGFISDALSGAISGITMNLLGLQLPLVVYAYFFGQWSAGFVDPIPDYEVQSVLVSYVLAGMIVSFPMSIWIGAAVIANLQRPPVGVGGALVAIFLLASLGTLVNTGSLRLGWAELLVSGTTSIGFLIGAMARRFLAAPRTANPAPAPSP